MTNDTKKVVVTGGSGKAGRACVGDLIAHGYQVFNVDNVVPAEPACPFIVADLADFGHIDARDAAQAIRRGLEVPPKGAEVFIIANSDTVMTRPTSELLAEVFPDVPLKGKPGANETLLSIEKARRVLGYEPQHSWRDPASRSK